MTPHHFVLLVTFGFAANSVFASDEVLFETFEEHEAGQSVTVSPAWSGFAGFRGSVKPMATVKSNVGVDASKALAISHDEPFRTDNFGLKCKLAKPIADGIVWVQCSFKPPQTWNGGLCSSICAVRIRIR